MTAQQEQVLAVLREEGRMSSLHLAYRVRQRNPHRSWTLRTVRLVLKQLQYRSLVEYDAAWQAVPVE